jgi:hypothetical protein
LGSTAVSNIQPRKHCPSQLGWCTFAVALLEAVAVAVHLQDMDMMGERDYLALDTSRLEAAAQKKLFNLYRRSPHLAFLYREADFFSGSARQSEEPLPTQRDDG